MGIPIPQRKPTPPEDMSMTGLPIPNLTLDLTNIADARFQGSIRTGAAPYPETTSYQTPASILGFDPLESYPFFIVLGGALLVAAFLMKKKG